MEKIEQKIQILLLEDDPFHRDLLAEGLEEYYDYQVALARNLEEAEEHLRSTTPDLLLLDCVLGDNRIQVIDWAKDVRRRPEFSEIPILFVTAFYQDMEKEARQFINSDILAKPFTFEDVTRKLRELVSRIRATCAQG